MKKEIKLPTLEDKLGWIVSNNEKGETVIQRDDELGRFKNDEEAVIHVVENYLKLLRVCELGNKLLDEAIENDSEDIFVICAEVNTHLWQAIQQVK